MNMLWTKRLAAVMSLVAIAFSASAQKYSDGLVDKTIAVVGNEMIKLSDSELKDKTASSLSGVLTEIRELEDNISNLRNQKDSDGKIKPEAESTIKECETRLTEKQAARDAAYNSFAAESDEMKQLVDLSLLSVGLLKGSALDNFISRSMKML